MVQLLIQSQLHYQQKENLDWIQNNIQNLSNFNQFFLNFILDYLLEDEIIDYPFSLQFKALFSNYGLGKGVVKQNPKRIYQKRDIFEMFKKFNLFEKYIHLSLEEFLRICESLKEEKDNLTVISKLNMNFENKVLIGLYFIIQYPKSIFLSNLWEVSDYYISKVIDEILPILTDYFIQFVYDRKSISRSVLSPTIKYITDTTIHKIRKPQSKQRLDYNGNYSMHGKLTQLLIDYDGFISGFYTFIPGRTSDALAAMYNKLFPKIIQSNFSLGDPGFNGVSYIIPGFKPSQVKTTSQIIFDRISRREQVMIENVNKFFKDFKSIDKNTSFNHGQDKLLGCICVAAGMYNYKRELGYYIPTNFVDQ